MQIMTKEGRLAQALSLRRAGYSYQDIATELRITERQAQRWVLRALRLILRETAEQVQALDLHRLDVLIRALWEPALREVEQGEYAKFDRVVRLVELRLRWAGTRGQVGGMEGVTIVINKSTGTTDCPSSGGVEALPAPTGGMEGS
jgi:hypothetical protein